MSETEQREVQSHANLLREWAEFFRRREDKGSLPRDLTDAADLIESLHRRVTKMEGDLVAILPGHCYMDPPDGGDVELVDQVRRMAEDATQWRRFNGDQK